MARLTTEQLTTPRGPATYVVELDDGDVTVRALLRDEVIELQKIRDATKRENLIMSLGMVDPPMTPDEVAAWASWAPAGELQKVSFKIGSVSGMLETSGKDATKSAAKRS